MINDQENLVNLDTARVVDTSQGTKNGQEKCPKCGSTDISLNIHTGKLRCNYCRYEFEPQQVVGLEENIEELQGQVIGSGASNINADASNMITIKCTSCGAEVVIDTAEATQARCHWCRNMLSINEQIPNGSVPDVVLPFSVSKEDAEKQIATFVKKRQFYAHPQFKKEFTTDNIMGVYFPYMIVDINAHASLNGEGEKLIRQYTEKHGDHYTTYYDADLYSISREFDLTINDLTIESRKDRLDKKNKNITNNVINAIMPFDTEHCVKWNANYLRGYTSEKRDVNIEQLSGIVGVQAKDIARHSVNKTIQQYNRGVCWTKEDLTIKGQQWQAAYLPVWLYSYQQVVNDHKKILHYVAVNARTKETMGSIPIHMSKLILVSSIIEVFGIMAMLFVDFDYSFLFATIGVIYFFFFYFKYRNSNARHTYEKETKTTMNNLQKKDQFIRRRTHLRNAWMENANNNMVQGSNISSNMLNVLMDQAEVTKILNEYVTPSNTNNTNNKTE